MKSGDLYKCSTNINAIADIQTGLHMSIDRKPTTSKFWTLHAPTKNKIIAIIDLIDVSSFSEDRMVWIALCEEKFYYLWFSHYDLKCLTKLN
jgi:hypothetical protein